jgi:hypothetical protein
VGAEFIGAALAWWGDGIRRDGRLMARTTTIRIRMAIAADMNMHAMTVPVIAVVVMVMLRRSWCAGDVPCGD